MTGEVHTRLSVSINGQQTTVVVVAVDAAALATGVDVRPSAAIHFPLSHVGGTLLFSFSFLFPFTVRTTAAGA